MRLLFLLSIISFQITTNINAQKDCLKNNRYISMPDKDTYTNRVVLTFNEDTVEIETSNTKHNNHYNITNNNLMINDSVNWGKIKCYKDYFELINKKDDISFQYTKLLPTLIDCSSKELERIILNSSWEANFENENAKIIISSNDAEKKEYYKIIKIKETYVLALANQWYFTINKISKNKIELYGLANSTNLPQRVIMTRVLK